MKNKEFLFHISMNTNCIFHRNIGSELQSQNYIWNFVQSLFFYNHVYKIFQKLFSYKLNTTMSRTDHRFYSNLNLNDPRIISASKRGQNKKYPIMTPSHCTLSSFLELFQWHIQICEKFRWKCLTSALQETK